ncbi:MAG: hypothetical protein K2X28_06065 [Alphaproteobacteria bacterium]|nr:hypothetical protein [Alphaproteobacteria bacterium]
MLKKNYLLVTVLSFIFISPAFSMTKEDSGSDPIPMETPRKEKTSQKEGEELQSSSSQHSEEKKAPTEDLKEAPAPSAKPPKKGRRWCCLFRTEDDD